MATIDDIKLNVGVNGAASLDSLDSKLGNIDKSAKATSETLKAFNIRNVSYQIQDVAVQLAMGTNAFVALGQQLPQLLSGFGVAGAVIGAVAAVAIPLLQIGLKAAGVDMRNLNEMTKDLTKSTTDYIDAQKQNQASLSGLGSSYGSLTPQAKEFFDVQEKLTKSKAVRDAKDAVDELKKSYSQLSEESVKKIRESARFTPGPSAGSAAELGIWWRQAAKGLTEEQGYAVSKMLKDIDAASPEKTVTAINNVLTYLDQIGPKADNFKQAFEKSVEPLMKINEQLIKQKENIRESAQRASDLTAEMLGLQSKYQPDINSARRNFDQIKAIRLEGEERVAQYAKQLKEKENKEGINTEKELAAFKLRTNQEVNDKVKDFTKSQQESYLAMILQNTAKKDQLSLQQKILGLSEEARLSAFNSYQLEQDLLTNANAYQEALKGIAEQRRKNTISASQQTKLEKDAADLREQSDQNAYSSAERRQKSFLETQSQIVEQDKRRAELNLGLVTATDTERKNAQDIFNINEERIKQLKGLEQLSDPILRLVKEKEVNAVYDERIENLKKIQAADFETQRKFETGWTKAFNSYVDNATNAAKQAETIFNRLTSSMEDMLVGFFKTGKLGWKDFLNSVVDAMMRSQVQQLIAKTFGGVGGVGGAGKGGLFGGAIIPGFLAAGGPANSNQPYIVGENGPELFVPNTSGTVVPNNQLPGAGSVTYNISAVDAMSFKQMIAQDPSFLYAVTEQGRRRMPGAR